MTGRELLAWNIRKIRTRASISQEALAIDAGIDRAYLGGIERGTENPSIDTIDKLAMTLDVPIAKLLERPRSGERPPQPLRKGRKPGLA